MNILVLLDMILYKFRPIISTSCYFFLLTSFLCLSLSDVGILHLLPCSREDIISFSNDMQVSQFFYLLLGLESGVNAVITNGRVS